MKVILSRKGFDSGAGGCPSPIIGHELISLPIPGKDENITYQDIRYDNVYLEKLVNDLTPETIKGTKKSASATRPVHLDPWIDDRIVYQNSASNMRSFGPNASGALLKKYEIQKGDLFLFFGWFREATLDKDRYAFLSDAPDLHIIWGYMQVGEVFGKNHHPTSLFSHPHYGNSNIFMSSNNLSCLNSSLPGCGVFRSDPRRVLTVEGEWRRSFWDSRKHSILSRVYPNDRTISLKDHVFWRKGRWQELVIDIGDEVSLIKNYFDFSV